MRVTPPKYRPITQGGANRVYLSGSTLNIRRPILALESVLRDSRYDFLFRPGKWCPKPDLQNLDAQPSEDIDALLKSWVGGDKPITILDLSGVPVSILMDLVGVLLRLVFDALFWSRYLPEGGRKRPLLFVMEEAHAYLNSGNDGAASIAARRIVKEGRKYGVGAMIVSQRPAEIDQTILSQCGTMFAMRPLRTLRIELTLSERQVIIWKVCSTCSHRYEQEKQSLLASQSNCLCARLSKPPPKIVGLTATTQKFTTLIPIAVGIIQNKTRITPRLRKSGAVKVPGHKLKRNII